MTRADVYKAIDTEREYQDALGQDRVRDPGNSRALSQGEALVLIRHYLRAAEDAWTKNPGESVVETSHVLRKIAAICVRDGEKYGMPYRLTRPSQPWPTDPEI